MTRDSLTWAAKRGDLVALEAALRSGDKVDSADSQAGLLFFMRLITAM